MGFGQTGRQIYELASRSDDVDVVAVADIGKPEILHYLLRSEVDEPAEESEDNESEVENQVDEPVNEKIIADDKCHSFNKSGKKCSNKGTFNHDNNLYCWIHSKKFKKDTTNKKDTSKCEATTKSGKNCSNKAHYKYNNNLYCGMHSRKYKD